MHWLKKVANENWDKQVSADFYGELENVLEGGWYSEKNMRANGDISEGSKLGSGNKQRWGEEEMEQVYPHH